MTEHGHARLALERHAEEGDVEAIRLLLVLARRSENYETQRRLALRLALAGGEKLWRNPIDGLEMICIPPGSVSVSMPRRKVTRLELPAFSMARHPVTNAQFAAFMEATGYRPPREHLHNHRFLSHWEGDSVPDGLAEHPVVFVSVYDALQYCEWAGLSLPSATHWEYAASGDGRPYPWGNAAPSAVLCAIQGSSTVPVGSFPRTRTAFGCQDMIGNVSDWCWPTKAGVVDGEVEAQRLDVEAAVRRFERSFAEVRGSNFMRSWTQNASMSCQHGRQLRVERRNEWVSFRPVYLPS
ncbi:MAG: hypothetical protein AUK47_13845 [Deltaproteobacteria bacterium CG2_30_63_29]|nr:MAG: hypothetical protein AUK47_13845 [Deltaproteobacteria bacterium CG2_30_63_29]